MSLNRSPFLAAFLAHHHFIRLQATDAQLELKRCNHQEPPKLEAWRFVLAMVLAGIVLLLQPGVNWK